MKNSPLLSLLTFHTPSSSPVPTSCSNRSNSSRSSSFEDFESNGSNNNSSGSPNSSFCAPYPRRDTSTGSQVTTTSTRDRGIHQDCNGQDNEDSKNRKVFREIIRKISIVGGSKFSWRTSSIIVMMLMSYYYYRRKHPNKNPWKSSSIITTSSIATAFGSTMLKIRRALLTYLGSLLLLPNKKQKKQERTTLQNVSISQLWDAANNKLITKALLNASTCMYRTSSTESRGGGGGEQPQEHWYRVNLPFQSSAFQTQLLNSLSDGGCKDIGVLPESWISAVSIPAILSSLPFLYLLLLYKLMQRLQQEQNHQSIHYQGSSSRSSTKEYNTTFHDVAGVDTAKIELMEVVECLKSPERYRRIGARPPRGILLYGPAGTGKTLLARAVAGEANCSCFLSCSASDFVEMLVGRGAARVRALFDTAKKEALRRHEEEAAQDRYPNARRRLYPTSTNLITRLCSSIPCFLQNSIFNSNLPHPDSNSLSSSLSVFQAKKPTAIIFIDEIDALAKSRMGGLHGNDEREQTLNQLLTEMDGFEQQQSSSLSSEVTIIVLAATNRPEILDSALLRPGRFDRHVYVGYPDARGREDILRLHTKHVKLDLYTVDLQRIATSTTTEGFTGADLRNVVNEAAFLALRDGRDSVGQRHLVGAMEKVGAMKRN